jgi:hypothetical protein
MRFVLIVLLLALIFSQGHSRHQNYSTAPPFNNQIVNTNLDLTDFHGAYTLNGSIYVNYVISGKAVEKKIAGGNNMELSWSPDGNWILFSHTPDLMLDSTRSSIMIIHPDGTGFHELTTDKYNDFNPTWSRDGSNFIIFNRFDSAKWRWYIYRTQTNANPGDEIPISDLSHNESGFTCLRDGRIIVFSDRGAENIRAYLFSSSPETDGYYRPPYMFVLTPEPGKAGKYEQMRFREKLEGFPFHMTLSKDETRLSYELDYYYMHKPFTYWTWKRSIGVAEIDASNNTVSNQNIVYDSKSVEDFPGFPSMTGDNRGLIYFLHIRIVNTIYFYFYYYDFKTKKSERISTPSGGEYLYFCAQSIPR